MYGHSSANTTNLEQPPTQSSFFFQHIPVFLRYAFGPTESNESVLYTHRDTAVRNQVTHPPSNEGPVSPALLLEGVSL